MKIFRRHTLTSILSLLMTLALCVMLCACSASPQEATGSTSPVVPTPSYTVAVICSDEDAENTDAYAGFVNALSDNGFVEGVNLELVVTNCEGDKTRAKTAAHQSSADEVDLIFTVGELSSKEAVKATSEIPIIFAGVADPIESGLLKSCEKPEGNVTGVSDYTPVHEQLKLIKTLCPDVKKVSTLYYTSDENSILISTLAKREAKALDLTYSAYTAATKTEYKTALSNALKKGEALYITDDKLTETYLESILKNAEKKNIPVFATDKSLVEKGCLATCYPDYEVIGYSAGELSLIVLKDLKPIASLAVEYADVYVDCADSDVAKKYNIDLSVLPGNSDIID